MPLAQGGSQDVISANIRTLRDEGYPAEQAAAIAYAEARRTAPNEAPPAPEDRTMEGTGSVGKSAQSRDERRSGERIALSQQIEAAEKQLRERDTEIKAAQKKVEDGRKELARARKGKRGDEQQVRKLRTRLRRIT